ncbi:MAG: M28 family peptidase [Bacteroidetes Order II. Incertae sedis bacterium]|jgi:hypothetical protein|nr:M28 family peptidase [Bacteroidetes Order II. bacterium]MBT6201694.1 M28 family peptidase [Bacteroidetes Order II. bacterium]MBT6424798.1 M28 family peptidase [Bacteroidetes Order II. bacterium]MBT6597613.1 M28 family peptidase [Bacteroidetes Order II. bacterium]MBT7400512.1 M28 family peptidase [Bacteroidetes Order II. bacterium]
MKQLNSIFFLFLLAITSMGALAQSGPAELSGAQLKMHVSELASDTYQGRRTGTEGADLARTYILGQVGDMAPCRENVLQPFSFDSRRSGESFEGKNIIGLYEGTEGNSDTIVLTAHFDHLGERNGQIFNGADDNASGTAVLIELSRFFHDVQPKHDIVIAFLDAEEMGLQGARHLVDSACLKDRRVLLNVNLDMVSRSQVSELYAVGTHHYPFLKPVLEGISTGEGLSVLFGHDLPGTGQDDWTMSSDHGPFHAAGIPFLYFGVEDHDGYHAPSDVAGDVTWDFFNVAANYILHSILAMDEQQWDTFAK